MSDVPPESSPHQASMGSEIVTRDYQQEMLNASLVENIVIAQDTGSGKTHIAILRIKIECAREPHKVSWFLAPTVALCEQQHYVIKRAIGLVGLIHGGLEPRQWTDPNLWKGVLKRNRVVVSTPQVLLDALSHGYINLGQEVALIVFDEAHHAKDDHPMNCIMRNFYFNLPMRQSVTANDHGPVREERPMILGLTASPMFGGNAAAALRSLELNLDSVIRSPRQHRVQLEAHIHRPQFRRVLYSVPWKYDSCHLASNNFLPLREVAASMDIQRDPYVLSLREQLNNTPPGHERTRIDQKLSKTISKGNSYTHKGIKDLFNTAHEICFDLGPWAADWYIQRVVKMALEGASPYSEITTAWQSREKAYLVRHLKMIHITPVSYDSKSIEDGVSDKLRVLIRTLEEEKARAESFNETYSGILFVTRRDSVLALAAVLENHPRTKGLFRIGCLLGSSESSYRITFLDITRQMLRQPQAETLDDFRSGEKNLLVATSVAEEGLDIQACGNVIRWDVPNNMPSWLQSRGRARRKRSSFVLMFEDGGVDADCIAQFERLERDMVAQYNANRKVVKQSEELPASSEIDDLFEPCQFKVESTGALLTLQAAVSHLNHFCSVLPNSRHTTYVALYDIDPPDMPEGWHALTPQADVSPPQGPFGCMLTLPKVLLPELRVYTVDRIYPTKRSAQKHVAFKAYLALYKAGLLNDHLLPLTSVVEPELEAEVQNMLKDIDKRDGLTSVTSQLNPWLPSDGEETWWSTDIVVDGLPALTLLTRVAIPEFDADELPVLYHPRIGPLKVRMGPRKVVHLTAEDLVAAQECTRRLFWCLYGSRMEWSDLGFAYLFIIKADPDAETWLPRRSWAMKSADRTHPERVNFVNVDTFTLEHGYPTDLTWVRDGRCFGKLCRFVGWHHEKLTEEEEAEICNRPMYSRFEEDVRVTYPLLVVEALPQRSNYLLPREISDAPPKPFHLLTKYSYLELMSTTECEFLQVIPSILRRLETAMIVRSFRSVLFPRSPLADIPTMLLTTAITAPAAADLVNYERMESLGDAVLKFIVAVNLLAAYPLWHEGYLTRRKDHAVANSRLAKEAMRRHMFRWIIRTSFAPKRFKPLYLSTAEAPVDTLEVPLEEIQDEPVVGDIIKTLPKKVEELSTKMLADVVESLIGAAYLHGGFELGVSCAQVFGLGLEWRTLPECVSMALCRVEYADDVSEQLANVERMVGYTFQRKLLLVESLTHGSYQYDNRTVSYERMEFLGDALLDMIVADFLYNCPGKTYTPHDIHIRKAAVVNTHFLAYTCFRTSIDVDASMPGPVPVPGHGSGVRGSSTGVRIKMQQKTDTIHLFQCLQHSSPVILEDQKLTFRRYNEVKDDIAAALATGRMFPWAALTRLQAQKLFSDMIESLIGAVYLDSEGDVDAVRAVLRRLGLLNQLERIARDDVDVLHPVSRLSVWASRQQKTVDYRYGEEKGLVICTLAVDGWETVSASAEKRGHASQEEARFAAAEKAIGVWNVM